LENSNHETVNNVIRIQNQGDLLTVANVFKYLQVKYNLYQKKIHEMSLIAGELCENILRHSGKGKIRIVYHRADNPFIEIISENIGALPEGAEQDGITTRKSLGIGLGIINRTSDIVTYEQEGHILRIRATKYCEDFPNRIEVAVLSYPVLFHDKCNGDGYIIHKNKHDLLVVMDALGHGEDACRSATAVRDFILQNPHTELDTLIYRVHDFIKDQKVRGVAISAVRLDYTANTLRFCGLGDVTTKIFPPGEETALYPFAKEGIAGDISRTLDVQEFPLVKGSIIAMFSDGLSSKLTIPLSRRVYRPIHLINDLMKEYGKTHDDRTLLLAKVI